MRKLLIDNIDYTDCLVDGEPLIDTKTEELNTGNIVLWAIEKTTFKPFSRVHIIEDSEEFWFVIDSYVPTKISNNPELYNYTISLVSEKKVLERIKLPNLKITAHFDTGKCISYINYLEHIFEMYITPKNLGIYMSDEMKKTEYLELPCPEIAWSQPTAKQVIDDLLNTIPNHPFISTINNGEMALIPLAEKGIDISKIDGEFANEPYLMAQDYANNLDLYGQNLIPQKVNARTLPLSVATSSQDGRVTTSNVVFQIPNAKIEKIEKLYCYAMFSIPQGSINVNKRLKIDITDYVKEISIYQTLDPSTSVSDAYNPNAKRYALSFTQGGDVIEGIAYTDKTWFIGADSQTAIWYILKNATGYEPSYSSEMYLRFECVYKSVDDTRVKIYRDIEIAKDLSLSENQGETFANMVAFAQAEREKVNRLSNEIAIKKYTFNRGDYIPKVGDYIGDYYLAKREVSYYNDFIIFKGTFSKNFIQKNVYYGLNTRIRYTNFAQPNNTLIRNDIVNFKVDFSFEQTSQNDYLGRYFALGFVEWYTLMIKRSPIPYDLSVKCAKADFGNGTQGMLLPSLIIGDYFTSLKFECADNISFAKRTSTKIVSGTQYLYCDFVSYTNDYGEAENVTYQLCYQLQKIEVNLDDLNIYDINYTYPVWNKELADEEYMIPTEIKMPLYKDNGEVIHTTMQFDFTSKDDNIVVGRALASHNSLSDIANYYDANNNGYISSNALYFCFSTTERYTKGDLEGKGTLFNTGEKAYGYIYIANDYGNGKMYLNGNFFRLVINENGMKEYVDDIQKIQSIGIVDNNNQLILGINKTTDWTTYNKIFINVERRN